MTFERTMELKFIMLHDDSDEPSLVSFDWVNQKYALRQKWINGALDIEWRAIEIDFS